MKEEKLLSQIWRFGICVNESLTLKFVECGIGKLSFSRRLLAWDFFEGMWSTKYVQAFDVSWNKSFKTMMKQLNYNWLSQGTQEYTTSKNLKAPRRKLMVEWLLESWASLFLEVIKESCKVCGLNLVLDGSEDDLIHCFKEGQTCVQFVIFLHR